MDERLKSVAEGVADAACEIDWLANQVPSPVLREELKGLCLRLHNEATALARAAGVSIYADEEEAA